MKQFKVFIASILFILFIPISIKWFGFLYNTVFGSKETPTAVVSNQTLDDEVKGHDNSTKNANAKQIKFKLKILPSGTVEVRYSESYKEYDTIIIPDVVYIKGMEMSVSNIGEDAFRYCSKLKKIVLPFHLKHIGHSAFSGCSELSNITLPSSLIHIENYAFRGCEKLIFLDLPYGLKSIGKGSFSNCISLTRITLPPTVTQVGGEAFESCTNLTVIVGNKKENVNFEKDTFKDCKSVLFKPTIGYF